MKRAYKGLIAAALSTALVMSLFVTSWASGAAVANAVMSDIVQRVLKYTFTPTTVNEGEDEIVEAMNYINSVWRTAGNCTGTVEVTYQTMSDLVVDLNMNGVPCQIAMWRGSGATGYVIKGTGKTPVCGGVTKVDITGKYFTNTAGAAFLAKSKSEITTPDTSTTTPTTPTINFDDTNIVNAVESLYDQLTWVIRCQFEQMQDTLLNGRILLNINDLVSKNVIPFLEDILVADTATSSTLQALYQSFENKFSDLDAMFGTDTSMQVHSGDLLTWDNMSRGFISATPDGTTNTVRLTPTKTLDGYNIGWSDDGHFTITPVSGVFPEKLNVGSGIVTMPKISSDELVTVPNPDLNEHIPSGYTQYARYTPYSSTPLDLGIVPQTNMEFRCAISAQDTATSPTIPQYFFGVDGLYMAISQDQKAVEVCSGSTVYRRSLDFSKYGYSAYVVWRFGESWRETLSATPISTGAFPATTKTLYLGQANGLKNTVWIQQPSGGSKASVNYAHSRYGCIDILDKTRTEDQGNLMYQFVPCKRDSDGVAGMYRVAYTNGAYSSGTFIPCGCEDTSSCADYHLSDQIPLTKETTVKTDVDVVRIYRDSGNFWHAVGADGSDLSFDATSAVALLKAFPVYEYNSVDAITSLPDGNYTMTWSGTAQAVTINYQAYSKFFAYIANQITYNRNWLDERLNHLNISADSINVDTYDDITLLGKLDALKTTIENISTGSSVDLSPLLESITGIAATQTDISSSLSGLNNSFESKFSELDTLFSDGYRQQPLFPGDSFSWNSRYQTFDFFGANDPMGTVYLAPVVNLDGYSSTWNGSQLEIICASGNFPEAFNIGTDTLTLPSNVAALRYVLSSDTWYMRLISGDLRSFDTASSAVLRQVFPVHAYDDFSGVTALPDGNWYVTWTGTASFVVIGYNQSSQFFVHMSNLASQMGEQQSMYLSGIDGSLQVLLVPEETGVVNLFTLENSLTSIETALSNLSFDVGDVTVSPTDLTDVVGRMDTIIDLLQNTAGDAACEHTYKQDMTTDATCTLPGLMVSTCSQCGDSYSEIIDSLGHDWQCTDHVAAVTDPETSEETTAAYDIYTCSRCGDTYNDYSGEGAPEDYSNTSISRLIVELFSRLGKLAGSLVAFVVNAFDKALTSVDNIISKFNSYTEQITGFGGTYPAWLGGLWGILPADLQVALTFAVVCMAVALVGKKLVFS